MNVQSRSVGQMVRIAKTNCLDKKEDQKVNRREDGEEEEEEVPVGKGRKRQG